MHRLVVQIRQSLDSSDSPAKVRAVLAVELPLVLSRCIKDQLVGELMLHAAYRHRVNCVKLFISGGFCSPNYCSAAGAATVLIIAAWSGNHRLVQFLLEQQGLDLQHRGSLAQTSLCGGSGPFSALEWATRKAAVCDGVVGFKQCVVSLRAAAAGELDGAASKNNNILATNI